jgi:hypothetical protein
MPSAQMGQRRPVDPLRAQNASYCWINCSGVKASAEPNTMWPALWTITSRRPASAMIWAMPASAEASEQLLNQTGLRKRRHVHDAIRRRMIFGI